MQEGSVIQEIRETIRTSKGLRDTLFEEIDALRKNKSNPSKARSIASLAAQILQSVKIEIEMHRYVTAGKLAELPELPEMKLGQAKMRQRPDGG